MGGLGPLIDNGREDGEEVEWPIATLEDAGIG